MSAERARQGKPETTPDGAEGKEKGLEEGVEAPEKEAGAEERPLSRFEKITGKIKEFWATQFKGEVREQTEDEEFLESIEETSVKVAKAGVPAIAGAIGSLLGVKSLVDVPRYLSQKYFTNKEKQELMEAFEGAGGARQEAQEEAQVEKDIGAAAKAEVGSRTAELQARIEGSKYMSAEKKAELLKRVAEIEAKHAETLAGAEDERGKEFAAALNEAIETKVKGTAALKETLNTMAVASGLSAARALVFGSVSLYERYQKVSKEMESGERKGSLFNEMVTKGLKETFTALTLREGKTTGEKIKNAAEALASVMRFGGMAAVGLNELSHEGITGAISKAIEGLQTEKITEFVGKNFAENTHHLTSFLHLSGHGGGAEHAAGAIGEHGGGSVAEHAGKLVTEHAGGAAAGGAVLSREAVSMIQEGLHVGETHLEVGTEIHEETAGEEHEDGHEESHDDDKSHGGGHEKTKGHGE